MRINDANLAPHHNIHMKSQRNDPILLERHSEFKEANDKREIQNKGSRVRNVPESFEKNLIKRQFEKKRRHFEYI